jgi:hypothetical protein
MQAKFSERFGGASRLYRAPGRVNLIGEHTDNNEGYVMPVAIGLSCWVAIGSRDDRKLAIYSEDLDESVELNLASPELRPPITGVTIHRAWQRSSSRKVIPCAALVFTFELMFRWAPGSVPRPPLRSRSDMPSFEARVMKSSP